VDDDAREVPSTGARRDEHLLRVPGDVEAEDDVRLQRIHDEVERGFDALRDIDDGVSVFGSARIPEGPAGTSSAARPPPASPATASPSSPAAARA